MSPVDSPAAAGQPPRTTTAITPGGDRLALWRLEPEGEPIGTVLVVPGFCRRMRHMAAPAHYLARNGFVVYRCDLTHHVGLSEGEVWTFTLSSMVDSLRGAVGAIADQEGAGEIGVVAASLSARAAIRVAAEDSGLAGVVGLVGVVDTQKTLAQVFGRDWSAVTEEEFVDYVQFERHRICGPPFWYDWHDGRWVGLDPTIEELKRARCPVVNLCGSADDWVAVEDVRTAFELGDGGPRHLIELPHAEHELSRNPVAAQALLEEMTRHALIHFADAGDPAPAIPTFDDVAAQIVLERRLERELASGHTEQDTPTQHESETP